MENTTLRQALLEKYASSLAGQKHWFAVSPEKAQAYKVKKIKAYNPENSYRHVEISEDMMIDIATDYSLFAHIMKAFENQQQTDFQFHFQDRYGLGTVTLTRYMLLQGLEHMIADPKHIEMVPQLNYVYDQMLTVSSLDSLAEMYQGTVTYDIDGNPTTFSPQSFFNLLRLSNDDFNFFVQNYDPATIGMPLEHFLYGFSQFTFDQKIYLKSYLDDCQLSRYQQICDYNVVDFQSLNYLPETDNQFLDRTHVHPALQEEILKDMPANYTDLQKAQYIYLKLCQTLTYDTEFYAVNQCGPRTNKHRKIEHIANITPENNQAVCYEIAAIYGKLLSVATDTVTHDLIFKNSYFGHEAYGEDHVYTEFRCGKFMASADTVAGIFTSDMTQQKLGKPVTGIKCLNQSKETIREFNESLRIVKQDLQLQTQAKLQGQIPTSFDEAIAMYRQETEDEQVYIDVPTRLAFCFNQVKDAHLTGLDAYSYLLQLRKVAFDKKEQTDNVAIHIVREGTDQTELPIDLAAIVTISNNYRDEDEECSYMVYKPQTGPQDISREDLMGAFNEGFYSYISQKDEPVPCIQAPVCDQFILNKTLE
ncbi:MAG: hypothetical protein IJW32_00900 [Clostridia bacterium]|nr:hypothetical protein [Clostridia bacterium]